MIEFCKKHGFSSEDEIKRIYTNVLRNNVRTSKEEKQKDAEKIRERFGWLYLHLTVAGKLIKIGRSFDENHAGGGHSQTYYGSEIVLRIRISLGPCNMEIATFRLKRAEKVVLCIFQEHLIAKSKDCEVLTVSFYSAPIMRRADQT